MSSAAPCSAHRAAFVESGSALMSLSRSPPTGNTRETTSERQVLIERSGGQSCSEPRAAASFCSMSFGQASMKGINRLTSSSTVIGPRLVLALSAPMSMMSAPSARARAAWSRAARMSKVPSPQNESSLMLMIAITSGRRGKVILCPRASRIMTKAKFRAGEPLGAPVFQSGSWCDNRRLERG